MVRAWANVRSNEQSGIDLFSSDHALTSDFRFSTELDMQKPILP